MSTPNPELLLPLDKLPWLDPEGLRVRFAAWPDYRPQLVSYDRERGQVVTADPKGYVADHRVLLDMADTETRARALRGLAILYGLDLGEAPPTWGRCNCPDGPQAWELTGFHCSAEFGALPEACDGWNTVPSLGELNPTDDTRLPDGSRLVDARALLLVAQHLGSQP